MIRRLWRMAVSDAMAFFMLSNCRRSVLRSTHRSRAPVQRLCRQRACRRIRVRRARAPGLAAWRINGNSFEEMLMGRPKRNGGPRINLRPPSLWFESNPHRVPWKPDMIAEEAARVRERFLDGTSDSIE